MCILGQLYVDWLNESLFHNPARAISYFDTVGIETKYAQAVTDTYDTRCQAARNETGYQVNRYTRQGTRQVGKRCRVPGR